MRRKKFLLEKDVQKKCVAYARERGWWARKFASPANRSVPDYLFAKRGYVFGVEFKKPGGKATEAQREELKAMSMAGIPVWVCDDVDMFKAFLNNRELDWLD